MAGGSRRDSHVASLVRGICAGYLFRDVRIENSLKASLRQNGKPLRGGVLWHA
jgi:hypothetical protein